MPINNHRPNQRGLQHAATAEMRNIMSCFHACRDIISCSTGPNTAAESSGFISTSSSIDDCRGTPHFIPASGNEQPGCLTVAVCASGRNSFTSSYLALVERRNLFLLDGDDRDIWGWDDIWGQARHRGAYANVILHAEILMRYHASG